MFWVVLLDLDVVEFWYEVFIVYFVFMVGWFMYGYYFEFVLV